MTTAHRATPAGIAPGATPARRSHADRSTLLIGGLLELALVAIALVLRRALRHALLPQRERVA